jgi:ribose 5-phosphate isomerase B
VARIWIEKTSTSTTIKIRRVRHVTMKIAVSSPKQCCLTEAVLKHLKSRGIQTVVLGSLQSEKVDYIEAARQLGEVVSRGECEQGVLFCYTGTGASIIANKYPGVRAALCPDSFSAKVAREANNANVLVIGIRLTGEGNAIEILDTWLSTSPSSEPKFADFHKRTDEIDQHYRKKDDGYC